ncbi:MAG: OsmC family protein [Leptospiraceae bacterium]|nr:OsmC family protein [Leptospiraceae bacterium]
MKIRLQRIEEPFVLQAYNESGNIVNMDASPDIGGKGTGARPMELLLMSLAGCSGIDVLSILKKQRQTVTNFEVEVDGERETGKLANLFVKINVHYKCSGEVSEEKLKHAIELSLEKYCSVAKTLEKTAQITYSYEIQN